MKMWEYFGMIKKKTHIKTMYTYTYDNLAVFFSSILTLSVFLIWYYFFLIPALQPKTFTEKIITYAFAFVVLFVISSYENRLKQVDVEKIEYEPQRRDVE